MGQVGFFGISGIRMSDTCRARVLTDGDLSMVLAWRNHPDTRAYMLTQHEISLEEHRAWFATASADPTHRLLIVEDEGGPIGCVQFNGVTDGGVADWGFYARPGAPKGSGRKLGVAALNNAFGDLSLYKVCGQALSGNEASIALHKSLGFVKEGVLRDQRRINGTYHSLICFGLLKHEWQIRSRTSGVSHDEN
ncbi:MAG: UDP-4-amino-4,6-dideoxy-N-acetyl-beta-L-altrosamine N-acetyltransferase [Sphingomonas sp.]